MDDEIEVIGTPGEPVLFSVAGRKADIRADDIEAVPGRLWVRVESGLVFTAYEETYEQVVPLLNEAREQVGETRLRIENAPTPEAQAVIDALVAKQRA